MLRCLVNNVDVTYIYTMSMNNNNVLYNICMCKYVVLYVCVNVKMLRCTQVINLDQ